MAYSDGTFTSVKQDGITRILYPFLNAPTKDTTTKQYEADYVILPGSYTPAAALSTWPGDGGTFAADNVAYLVEETAPQRTAGAYRITRRYSNIPGTQTRYGAQLIVRPVMHDLVSSTTYAVSFDDGATSHLFTARKTVTAVGAITAASATEVQVADTLPTATITIARSTGADFTFSTTDSQATIRSTFDTNLATTTKVVKSAGLIEVVFSAANWLAATTTTAGIDLVVSDPDASGYRTLRLSGTTINPEVKTNIRTLTSAGHGGAAGELLAAWNGDKLVGTTKVIAVATDTVTVAADESPWAIGSLAVTHMQFADTSSTRYVNGPISVTTKIEESFYLPTVTGGITTPADIPLVAPKLDPVSWLAAIVAGTAFLPIQGSDLTPWEGPIYRQTTVSAQMSDALDTVSVSA